MAVALSLFPAMTLAFTPWATIPPVLKYGQVNRTSVTSAEIFFDVSWPVEFYCYQIDGVPPVNADAPIATGTSVPIAPGVISLNIRTITAKTHTVYIAASHGYSPDASNIWLLPSPQSTS